MLSLIPLVVMGGVAMKFTDEYIRKPIGRVTRKKAKRFDELECRDLRRKRKGMEFGDFSNIGW